MSNLPRQFLIENKKTYITKFITYIENNRTHYPSVLEGDDNDEFDEVIDQLESANHTDSPFNGGYFGVTYDVSLRISTMGTGHFYLDYMGGTEIYDDGRLYDPNVKKFPDTENYSTPPQSPRKPNGGKRRKKKTRKKRGGMSDKDNRGNLFRPLSGGKRKKKRRKSRKKTRKRRTKKKTRRRRKN